MVNDILEERYFGKSKREHIREFACLLAIIMLIIGSFRLYHSGRIPTALSLFFVSASMVVIGYRLPMVLLPVWESWMKIATVLGAVVSSLLVIVVWIVIVVPTGLLMRMFGHVGIDMKFREERGESYWRTRDPKEQIPEYYERQF